MHGDAAADPPGSDRRDECVVMLIPMWMVCFDLAQIVWGVRDVRGGDADQRQQ